MHPRLYEENFGLQVSEPDAVLDDSDPLLVLMRREEEIQADAVTSLRDKKLKRALDVLHIKLSD